jgi:hypothetical protein
MATTTTANGKSAKQLEANRQRDRERVRQQIAQRETALGRVRALDQQLRDCDARMDAAVAAHQCVCLPAQEQIQRLESQITAAIVDRRPVPESLEQERLAALQRIEAENEKLEDAKRQINLARQRLTRAQHGAHAEAQDLTVLRNSLAREPLANPALLLQLHIAKQAVKWAELRQRAADEQTNTWRAEVAKARGRQGEKHLNSFGYYAVAPNPVAAEHEATYAARLKRWEAELVAAGGALREAMESERAVFQALVDE